MTTLISRRLHEHEMALRIQSVAEVLTPDTRAELASTQFTAPR